MAQPIHVPELDCMRCKEPMIWHSSHWVTICKGVEALYDVFRCELCGRYMVPIC